MKLTVNQALQQGIAAHKEGKLGEAERLYRTVLKIQPAHPDANHNLRILAISLNKTEGARPILKTGLEGNQKIEQFWRGLSEDRVDAPEEQLMPISQLEVSKLPGQKKRLTFSEKRKNISANKKRKKAQKQSINLISPSHSQLNSLSGHYQNGRYDDAEKLAISITEQFPKHQFSWKVLGVILQKTDRLPESLVVSQKSVKLVPQDAEAHNNLGNTLLDLGRLEDAEVSYRQAIALKPDYAEAHSNLGAVLQEFSRLEDAEASFRKAIGLKPDFTQTLWNLSSVAETIQDAEYWIDKCLVADTNHVTAKLIKAALRFYQGDRVHFDKLMLSEFKQHSYMRSFSWTFSLPNLPELYFNRWSFFDAIVKQSITSRPFYEFGVWRGAAFKYLIKSFKKGYGFDTFTGLPEEWAVGHGNEKAGNYSSDGNIPNIKGGEFIAGKFEDTLPIFYSVHRPLASVINFDADLYSSTLCALNYSKSVMDKHTVLIFDEFIINESWEQDEFKALNEFASINNYTYEVVAISFFTKQVAVKLIGI
jgi:Flp pilus assembly protein TadD